jgi:Mg2+ and Co2+ transporter CorA
VAAKKPNGHDPSTDRIVEVLERIEKRLERVEHEVHGLREETREELTDLRGILNGEREGLIKARLAKLEAAVFKPSGS